MSADRLPFPRRLAVGAVRVYQRAFKWKASPCRFVPSCSAYAVCALEDHGVARGSWLAARRIGRCNPWGQAGWDPVPPRRHQRSRPAEGSVVA
jgi:putative membrane protein insertion efficiency factor